MSEPTGRDYGLPPAKRLRRQRDFERVYKTGQHAADSVLVVVGCRNGLGWSRLGLNVSRKVGTAVTRNRWKRLIRESFRLQQHELPQGLDLVVRPRRNAVPEFNAIRRSLRHLCRRVDRLLPVIETHDPRPKPARGDD